MMPMDISEILEKIDIWDAENVFHLKSDPSRLKKIIAHYELFKKIQNVEGDFLDAWHLHHVLVRKLFEEFRYNFFFVDLL